MTTCVKTIIDEISSLEWDIVQTEDYEYSWVEKEIKIVKKFLEFPNKNDESFGRLIRALLKDILEIDAGVLVKVFDIDSYDFDDLEPKSGAPMLKPMGQRNMTEVYVRDGASFLKEIDKFGFEKGFWQYSYQIPAHPMWFNRDEIVYCKEHPRSMSCYGFSRVQSIMDIVKSLHYSTLYNKRFFEETTIPDGILSLLETNEPEIKEFMSYWNNEFKAQPHKVAVVNKDVKWQPFSISQKELEFLDTQRWYFNMVVSAFGLSPNEVGVTESLNRSTSATQSELVKRKSIRPFLKLLETYINKGIISEFGFEGIQFQFIYDDPAEKKMRLDNWALELSMGVKTINEVRNELGMEPIEGGDVSNSFASRMGMQEEGEGDRGLSAEEETQSSGQDDERERSEGKDKTKKKVKPLVQSDEEKERLERIRNPFSDSNRPVGNFKQRMEELVVNPEQLRIGIDIEREHAVSLQLTLAEITQIALDHLAEDPNYYSKLIAMEKGVNDGQYYHDQPISQPKRPSGAENQPQNPGPDTNPSQLGSDHRNPDRDKYKKDDITCPMCGQPTLTYLNSLEDLGKDDVRCTSCGSRFNEKDLLDAPLMEEMVNVLQQHNISNPISIPAWKPKSYIQNVDSTMTVKSYAGFDVSKSYPFTLAYVNSKHYFNLLRGYLSDLKIKDIFKIRDILKGSFNENTNITDITNRINEVINDYDRSNMIAKTEVIRLANEGNLMRLERLGNGKVEFISAPEDGRLCRFCKEKDGKILTIQEARGLIPLHPRCRCTTAEYNKI